MHDSAGKARRRKWGRRNVWHSARKAIETARRIGKVQVDHGETNCKTPDAVPYIEKAANRKRCP